MLYEEQINKLENHLKFEKDKFQKLKQMDVLRYYYKLNEEEKDKVKYDEEKDELILSKSLEIGIEITKYVPKVLSELQENEKTEAINIMKNNYYYLAGYLFSYYAIAIEFGIPPEKQFLAPRTSVLIPIAKELEKFYYKPKAVMTISMPQGTGKEQPLSSKILTPEGWITMGEVKIGTKVIGADGKPCNVTGVYPKGIKDVYRVTFDDHSFVDCGLEHLWEVKTRYDRINNKTSRVINTQEMLKNFNLKRKDNKQRSNYSIRLVKPIKFENKLDKDDISPYILGSLIGNGTLGKEQIRYTSDDKENLDRIIKELPDNIVLKKYNQEFQYGIVRGNNNKNKRNIILQKLEEYELLEKKSSMKFIPKKYLYSSIEDRINLLRGLMDTDGDCSKCGYKYTTTSKQLKDDIIELVRGLGGKANYYEEKSKTTTSIIYRIRIVLNINPFYITRKSERYIEPKFNYQKMIVNIEKIRQEECQCIMIDHPEHLYVTDGYTLTHNTELGKRFMSFCVGKESDRPCMMVSYSASIAKEKFYRTE